MNTRHFYSRGQPWSHCESQLVAEKSQSIQSQPSSQPLLQPPRRVRVRIRVSLATCGERARRCRSFGAVASSSTLPGLVALAGAGARALVWWRATPTAPHGAAAAKKAAAMAKAARHKGPPRQLGWGMVN